MADEKKSKRVMRCYYEVLGVKKDATPEVLKQSYKKLALQLHPDKNPDNPDAVEKFKELQNAYAILSDPQERAWYDSHRESILRGKTEGEEEDDSIDLYPYMTSSAYSGYGDDPNGFYAVYDKLFKDIAAEEKGSESDSDEESEEEDEDEEDELAPRKSTSKKSKKKQKKKPEKREEPPTFGTSKSDWKDVNKFYNYWSNFVSKRSYAFADKYKPSEAPNRKVKRLIEKENKKERDRARRARTEEIRHLVDFVKKRDKRVIERQIQLKQEEEEKKKIENEEKKKLEEKRREERKIAQEQTQKLLEQEIDEKEFLELYADSTSYKKKKKQQKKGDGANGSGAKSNGLDGVQSLYCIVCKKGFKSQKQWENHERSKAHQEKLAQLRDEVLLEGEEEFGNEEDFNESSQVPKEDNEDEVQKDETVQVETETESKERQTEGDEVKEQNVVEEVEGLSLEDEEDEFLRSSVKKAQEKKRRKKAKKKAALSAIHSDSD